MAMSAVTASRCVAIAEMPKPAINIAVELARLGELTILVGFTDDGSVLVSQDLSETAGKTLAVDTAAPLQGLRDGHRANLAVHRARYGFS